MPSPRTRSARLLPAVAAGPALVVIAMMIGIGFFDDDWGSEFIGIQGAEYTGKIARNLCRFDAGVTKWHNAWIVTPADPPIVAFYSNHPALYFAGNALLYRVFGEHPSVLKSAAALVYLLTAIGAVWLVKDLGLTAALAAAVVAACPPI